MRELQWKSPNGKWKIFKVVNPNTGKIDVEVTDDYMALNPIRYDSGHCVYDNPEWLPKYILDKTQRVVDNLHKAGEYGRYVGKG